jgi:environmental stress-induced protein Ves
MQILRAASHRRMRWKNGQGETTEIAVSPEGASLDAFDWRVSMATVAADAPFSAFPGIDRTLCVLEGAGISLSIEGRGDVTLTTASAPFAFPADAPTTGRLLGGRITDLNVMTARGRFRHIVRRLAIEGDLRFTVEAGIALILARRNGVAISSGTERMNLELDDTVLIHGQAELTLTAAQATVFVIEIERTA